MLLVVNDEFTASIVIGRCLTTQTGARHWKLRLDVWRAPTDNDEGYHGPEQNAPR